jgi:hypothetical protein
MPNSKARSVARKHRKSSIRWKNKNKASLALAKDKASKTKKKVSVFDRARAAQQNVPLSGATPSAVSNPTGERRTASMMTFDELKANGG